MKSNSIRDYGDLFVKEPAVSDKKILASEDVAAFCSDLAGLDREILQVLLLDSKNHLIRREIISIGTVDCSIACPREVFKAAVLASASTIVLVHNHPSGDPSPSEEDIGTTSQMVECGRIMGIPVSDHVIIAKTATGSVEHISLRASMLAGFDETKDKPKRASRKKRTKKQSVSK